MLGQIYEYLLKKVSKAVKEARFRDALKYLEGFKKQHQHLPEYKALAKTVEEGIEKLKRLIAKVGFSQEEFFKPEEVVYAYTRKQAIEDGVLVDVSEMAREAGFTIPVAVTRGVWADYIVPDPRARQWGQSESGRLWDTLYMGRLAARAGRGRDTIFYRLYFIMKEKQRRLITLKIKIHPGDAGEPVITIMKPEED